MGDTLCADMHTRSKIKRWLMVGAGSLMALAGCASTPVPPVSVSSQLGQGVTDANGELVGQLDFLDRLEGKRVTTWDEMLSGILLTANKRVGPTYSARLGQARSFGLVGPDAPSNGDTPATPAALARALLRARGERFDQRASSEDLVAIAQQRGLLPARLSPNDILSGAVTVGALVAVGEPTTRSPLPARSARRAGQTGAQAARRTRQRGQRPGDRAGCARAGAGGCARAGAHIDGQRGRCVQRV
jgi:hypothetical protein